MSTKKLSKVSNLLKGEILKYIPNFFNIIKLSKQYFQKEFTIIY